MHGCMYDNATYAMNLWTKNLKPVERINLSRFGIGVLFSLRGMKDLGY